MTDNIQDPEKKEEELIINNFDDMQLKTNLLRGIYGYGFEKPSLIQSKAIPYIMSGKDLIAQSQAGTGKTGAFVISAFQKIDESVKGTQAIILAHTRELAQQIYEVSKNLGQYTNIKTVLCIGGQNIQQTQSELSNETSLVIGTPGRIIDLIKRRIISTRLIRILIIDEADEMLSYSFQEQIKTIIKYISDKAQVCLFSATLSEPVLELTKHFMNEPHNILIKPEKLTLDGVKQFYIDTDSELWKFETLCDIYNILSVSQTIIYVNTIKRSIELKKQLEEKRFTVSLIHSDMPIDERIKIMKDFRSGSSRILISTDLLARGIDIQQISIVINYDFPRGKNFKESYIHRIGRSGRFGKKGIAINLLTKHDVYGVSELKDYYKTNIEPMPENVQDFL
ncbi:translation initiation factor 4A-III [Klosneuvirus KNV1]|uniref:RNA helicase n=1 Tax=Klosneuvirus KNV1 TaxID=1977640 RepID=A0A1V0SIR5_9VIRU|nr:translation initiation factor 4A-III [Klosneuvirus KNV1]